MTVPANYGTEYSVEFPYRNAAYTALAAYAATALLKYSNNAVDYIQSTPYITLKLGSVVVSALLKKCLILKVMFCNENN